VKIEGGVIVLSLGEVGAVMEKLRKARVLKIRSYVLTRVSTLAPNQNLIIKLKNFG